MIFISYSWSFKEKAQEHINHLRKTGEDLWVDDEQLDLSKPLQMQIEKAINECDVFLQLYIKNSPKSAWMKYEYATALKIKKSDKIMSINIE